MDVKKTNVTRIVIIVAVFAVLLAGFVVAYIMLSDKPVEGGKTITVEVIGKDSKSNSYTINTDEEYLRAAINSDGQITLGGDESEFGLFIKTVNGITVSEDPTAQEWWSITKNGEMLMTGIDTTVIMDGEKYEITFMVGYDSF